MDGLINEHKFYNMKDNVIELIGGIAIGLLVYISLVRYVFRIDTQVHNQEKIIKLLEILAKQNGMPTEELNTIMGVK